jgi:endonuclease-3 related protein
MILILCGLPLSGKTTIARNLAKLFDADLIEVDAVGTSLGYQTRDEEVWQRIFSEAEKSMRAGLKAGRTVIFDATNYRRAFRKRLLAIATTYKTEAFVIWVNPPFKLVKQRFQSNFAGKLRPHHKVSKQDWLEVVDDFQPPDEGEPFIELRTTIKLAERMRLLVLYDRLKQQYGPQGWWPVTTRVSSKPMYQGGPTNEREQFEVCLGAILTQNTAWSNVEKALSALHQHGVMDCSAVLKTPEVRLARWIRPSGYFNQKAKKLKAFCIFLAAGYTGRLTKLFALNLRELRTALLAVKGIGPETADSIILYAARKPVFVIDAYTRRIMKRLGYQEQSYEELQDLFLRLLPQTTKLFDEYHALIVRHAKVSCRKTPLCGDCGLRSVCKYGRKETLRGLELHC